jgi:hypothetical protein
MALSLKVSNVHENGLELIKRLRGVNSPGKKKLMDALKNSKWKEVYEELLYRIELYTSAKVLNYNRRDLNAIVSSIQQNDIDINVIVDKLIERTVGNTVQQGIKNSVSYGNIGRLTADEFKQMFIKNFPANLFNKEFSIYAEDYPDKKYAAILALDNTAAKYFLNLYGVESDVPNVEFNQLYPEAADLNLGDDIGMDFTDRIFGENYLADLKQFAYKQAGIVKNAVQQGIIWNDDIVLPVPSFPNIDSKLLWKTIQDVVARIEPDETEPTDFILEELTDREIEADLENEVGDSIVFYILEYIVLNIPGYENLGAPID